MPEVLQHARLGCSGASHHQDCAAHRSCSLPGLLVCVDGLHEDGLAMLDRGSFSVDCVVYTAWPGLWCAVCLDWSLFAQSTESRLDAQNRLVEQMLDYVRDLTAAQYPPHLVDRSMGEEVRQAILARPRTTAWQIAFGPHE